MKIYDSVRDTVIDVADGLGKAMLKHNNVKNGGRYGEATEIKTPEPMDSSPLTTEEPKKKRKRRTKAEIEADKAKAEGQDEQKDE